MYSTGAVLYCIPEWVRGFARATRCRTKSDTLSTPVSRLTVLAPFPFPSSVARTCRRPLPHRPPSAPFHRACRPLQPLPMPPSPPHHLCGRTPPRAARCASPQRRRYIGRCSRGGAPHPSPPPPTHGTLDGTHTLRPTSRGCAALPVLAGCSPTSPVRPPPPPASHSLLVARQRCRAAPSGTTPRGTGRAMGSVAGQCRAPVRPRPLSAFPWGLGAFLLPPPSSRPPPRTTASVPGSRCRGLPAVAHRRWPPATACRLAQSGSCAVGGGEERQRGEACGTMAGRGGGGRGRGWAPRPLDTVFASGCCRPWAGVG